MGAGWGQEKLDYWECKVHLNMKQNWTEFGKNNNVLKNSSEIDTIGQWGK